MQQWQGKCRITIVSACMRADGTSDFASNEVEVTHCEAENGIHYELAEAKLFENGYEEPFVHFDDSEAPAFLQPAVRHYLHARPLESASATPVLSEVR